MLMRSTTKPLLASILATLALVPACTGPEPQNAQPDAEQAVAVSAAVTRTPDMGTDFRPPPYDACTGEAFPFDPGDLVAVDPFDFLDIFVQKLPKATQFSNAVLHVKLPPARNRELERSLVRVVGSPENPLVLFRSDALVELGFLRESPGKEFFTAAVQIDPADLREDAEFEQRLARSLREGTEEVVVFQGRSPVARTRAQALDVDRFVDGGLIHFDTCAVRPVSNQQRWGESLFITDPAVVQDPARTYDPCTGAGNASGAWTFKHLMTEMSIGSGYTPEDFTRRWLETWLVTQPVNGDLVAPRADMQAKVIAPWLARSGGARLNLDIAPFRLLAIVNRADLRHTASARSPYGGGGGTIPVDAGELRFVFGVVTPPEWNHNATCELHPFTTIFEYGVPRSGCEAVRAWARDWTTLNQFGGFTAGYLAHLQGLTESVVRHGAAPSKGNQSALNQLRTNEILLDRPWEMREFTLTDESNGDAPASGLLRPHSVAQTPDDAVFAPTPDPIIDSFVQNQVIPTVPGSVDLSTSPPQDCSSTHEVPLEYLGIDFRGGNALIEPAPFWSANVGAGDADVCGRHQFSLNTCNGCHRCDTATSFTHVDPTSGIPAQLSGFLLGVTVPDTQFGSPQWHFADLERRFADLYDLACASCAFTPVHIPEIFERMPRVPIDPDPILDIRFPFEVGPITDIKLVGELFRNLDSFVNTRVENIAIAEDFAQGKQLFTH
jgi:hypothetical protein